MSVRAPKAHRSLAGVRPERMHSWRSRSRTGVWRPWTLAWFGACGLAIANAIVRQAIYEGQVGDLTAHQISTGTFLVIFTAYVWMVHRRWPVDTAQTALAIGASWVILTLVFEFGFGHYAAGQSWPELLGAYNLTDGHVWALVPLWTLVAPAAMRGLQQPSSH